MAYWYLHNASLGDFARGQPDEAMTARTGIDHLIYASSNLQRGMDEIEELLGVRPVRGGRHPGYGTHNALLSLGAGTYLEIIARDPDLPAPEKGAFIDVPAAGPSRLITWVFRAADIVESSKALEYVGINLGPVESGSRQNPDGSVIHWELTDPYAMPLQGAVPFLISWGNTVHPSEVAPSGGRLVELVIEHPDADRVRGAVSALGAEVKVTASDRFLISARVETKNGIVTISQEPPGGSAICPVGKLNPRRAGYDFDPARPIRQSIGKSQL